MGSGTADAHMGFWHLQGEDLDFEPLRWAQDLFMLLGKVDGLLGWH